MEIFCFFFGIIFTYTHHYLPLISLFALFFITPRMPLLFFFLLGIGLAMTHLWFTSAKGLPITPIIPHAVIQGTIDSIPLKTPSKTQFTLALTAFNGKPAQGLVQLAWYNKAPPLHPGQRWQFAVKLKKPRNFHNPGSYDYVNALGLRHLTWTGYIQNKGHLLAPAPYSLLTLREQLGHQLSQLSPDSQTAGVIEALTLNFTGQISQETWSLFRRTGTTHLFGISGEHIALLSGAVFWILRRSWCYSSTLCLRFPALYPASIGGLLVALCYSLLAGFGPPVQRALLGCFFFTLYCLGKQRFTAWQIWRYALFAVLCYEPHAVFMQGFYYSFLAVACMMLTQQRWQLAGYKATLALQLCCLLGLMPLTLYWFNYGSINGFLANLFAIPLVGLLIVPLALLTLLFCSCSWAYLLMKPLAWLVALLFKGLELTEQLAFLNVTYAIPSIALVAILTGGLFLALFLPTYPFRYIGLLWLILPFFPHRLLINPGEALIQVLDVGQGLAVTVRTADHVLLYDTGDQFFKGSDLGKMVILPFYQAEQVHRVDKIVISHPDRDHRGGLKSIESSMPVGELLVNNRRYYNHGVRCHEYPQWTWDGVTFRFFPIKKVFKNKNNASCILQVSSAAGRVLFTGDIEKEAEDYLTKTYGSQLTSDVLIVPHHGSQTSSSYRFLLEVAPRYAIASLGFANRFHFPSPKTLGSLASLGIDFFRTDTCGMVQVVLPKEGAVKPPVCFETA